MLYNILHQGKKRTISFCNFNQHIRAPHPDRCLPVHDLVYIKEGTWTIFQDGIRYDLIPGDVILLQTQHHHYGVEPCDSVVKTRFVHFDCCPEDRIGEKPGKQPGEYAFPMVVHCEKNPLVEHFFEKMIYAYWSDGEHAKNKASAYLDLLLCEISGMRLEKQRSFSVVEKAKLEIQETPERFIGNQELAEKCCCSLRTLTSKFKAETGCSPHAWQMRQKCEMAGELMKADPSLTLKEAAATFGFYDEYHFSKCFKNHFGYPPKNGHRR